MPQSRDRADRRPQWKVKLPADRRPVDRALRAHAKRHGQTLAAFLYEAACEKYHREGGRYVVGLPFAYTRPAGCCTASDVSPLSNPEE